MNMMTNPGLLITHSGILDTARGELLSNKEIQRAKKIRNLNDLERAMIGRKNCVIYVCREIPFNISLGHHNDFVKKFKKINDIMSLIKRNNLTIKFIQNAYDAR